MELATRSRNSGFGRGFAAGCRSEGLSPLRFSLSRSHFSASRVNECSDRRKRLRGRWLSSESVIASGDRVGPDRGVAARAFGRASRSGWSCEHTRLRAVWLNCRAIPAGSRTNVPRSLAVIWFHATRLETRTKESDACASLRVTETLRRNESEGEFGSSR